MSPLQARRERHSVCSDASNRVSRCGIDEEDRLVATKSSCEKYFRRFGCLAYFLQQPRETIPKLVTKWRKGVFLGYNEQNSSWKIGTYAKDQRYSLTIRWAVYETRDVKFVESVLIDNIDSLRPSYSAGVVVSDEKLLEVATGSKGLPGHVLEANLPCGRDLGVLESPQGPFEDLTDVGVRRDQRSEGSQSGRLGDQYDHAESLRGSGVSVPTWHGPPLTPYHPDNHVLDSELGSKPFVGNRDMIEKKKKERPEGTKKEKLRTTKLVEEFPDVSFGKKLVTEVKRQRKTGVHHKPRRTGKYGSYKPRKPKDQSYAQETESFINSVVEEIDSYYSVDNLYCDFDTGETVEDVWIQITESEAMKAPDAPNYIEAINKERTKLVAFKTWEKVSDEDLKRCKFPVPIALLLSRKRDGTYKCRAVVLGNLYRPSGDLELYAPVVSQNANRYLLVDACAHGDHIILFDIDNAFVQSLIDSEIFVRLPKAWREENDDGVRRLLKALYGLPQAARLWAKHYESKLIRLGWHQSTEKGLWRKKSKVVVDRYIKLGVNVDDNTATGPDNVELTDEVDKVLHVFPGKILIGEDMNDGWIRHDQLGADFWYKRSSKEMKFVMARYIDKIAKRFKMENCRLVDSLL